jgi:hypothetical protein
MTLTFPQAVDRLNRFSRLKWGPTAPQYSYEYRGAPRTYFVHRINQNVSPYIPAAELWTRGPREHCLAKVMSAISAACK